MPPAQVGFSKLNAAVAAVVLSVLLLAAACSSPKTAAVPVANPAPAVVAAAEPPNPGSSAPKLPPDPFVAAVRAGTMSGYPQATIGQAFEAAFRDAHWSSQQPKGEARTVTFTGVLPASMRPSCGAKIGSDASPCAQDAKVTFEWSFASDGHLFHLSRVNPEAWPETHRSTRDMMLYIFG